MGEKLPAIKRPNGKLYRPRRLRAYPVGDEESAWGIYVFGTHSLELARPVAERLLAYYRSEFDVSLRIVMPARLAWERQRLAYFEDDGARYYYETDSERGYAAVRFDLEDGDAPEQYEGPGLVPGQTTIDPYGTYEDERSE